MGNVFQLYFTYKFIRLLVTPWEKTPAYKVGIIDEKGNLLVKVKDMTSQQEKVYSYFDRLVYNLKRMMSKIPGGNSKLASYAAALYLIKENCPSSFYYSLKYTIEEEGAQPPVEGSSDNIEGQPTSNINNIEVYPQKITKKIIRRKKVK